MLARGFKQLLAEANAVIETISVQEAIDLLGKPGVTFVDVREAAERQKTGAIPGAVHASRGFLEFHADPESPMHAPALASGNLLVVYCASGGRSTLAVKTLAEMGIDNVCNLAGGFGAWQQAGGPVER
jgi:rhodanese-related sulfurtransferase